jgi:hypothetical protein
MIIDSSTKDHNNSNIIELVRVELEGENYYKIANSDKMRPFFMSIVSDSNHWLFISSNGGLTAGRKNADFALFPYYTDDKITESAEVTGSKSIFQISTLQNIHLWEPFSIRNEGEFKVQRNIYKHEFGHKIIFEELNFDLKLTFRYQWSSSNDFGFVRTSTLINNNDTDIAVSLIDGIQNIVPYGVGADLQNQSSNLVDAYKRSELLKDSKLGIYALSAIIVDKAEPSEALKANIVWSLGLTEARYLLSSQQLNKFRERNPIEEEWDIKGEKGCYFIHSTLSLSPAESKQWMIITNVNQDHSSIIELSNKIITETNLKQSLVQDIDKGTSRLLGLNAGADGLQLTAFELKNSRHFSNTLFNIMRGGIFDFNYQVEKWDFIKYLEKANKKSFQNSSKIINDFPDTFTIFDIRELTEEIKDKDFKRLCLEYLPLKFSRRHGDPSRPWNKFSINTRNEIDGSKILDYEGNWRDIFQNWEALALSYPEFIDGMIYKFLNASTFDGYNPYRVTKDGFDWETIEPDNPWSYIGYWGDHQIIYLLKFLEFIEDKKPGKLKALFNEDIFVYANVPYRIKDYNDILKNPKDTIEFDHRLDEQIRNLKEDIGADGALMRNQKNEIHHVNFIEKILATVLAKISNFVPEGGIWMNTQRPEWNDANNALVGNGVSMVTLYYIRRFLKYFQRLFRHTPQQSFNISSDLIELYKGIFNTFEKYQNLLSNKINDDNRKLIVDSLGQKVSSYRNKIYENRISGKKGMLELEELSQFVDLTLMYIDHSIRANKRVDNLYHSYNLISINGEKGMSISYLSEMLEGQVAVLSSGILSPEECVDLLDGLKNSSLYREDQYSYLLYPNKQLPKFLEKNNIPASKVEGSRLLSKLVEKNESAIIIKDFKGNFHFNGNFKNANDLSAALDKLSESKYSELIKNHKQEALDVFEEIFNHKAFTGRSGTFYGYEGLGSIYWHMVSKLRLAVYECCVKAHSENSSKEILHKLINHYYEIQEGIGVNKPPALYGAFPIDPYSHTPAGKGAQQPGMTGQVKEDILSRFGELGIIVKEGKIVFDPFLLKNEEFLTCPKKFDYINIDGKKRTIELEKNTLAFTYCQVPVQYVLANKNAIEVRYSEADSKFYDSNILEENLSNEIFKRTGSIQLLKVSVDRATLI